MWGFSSGPALRAWALKRSPLTWTSTSGSASRLRNQAGGCGWPCDPEDEDGAKWTKSRVNYTVPVNTDPNDPNDPVFLAGGQVKANAGVNFLETVGSFSASGPIEIGIPLEPQR